MIPQIIKNTTTTYTLTNLDTVSKAKYLIALGLLLILAIGIWIAYSDIEIARSELSNDQIRESIRQQIQESIRMAIQLMIPAAILIYLVRSYFK